MGIDFSTTLSIAAAAVLCIFAAALAYDPGGITDPAPLAGPSVKDGEMLLALYEAAEMYRNSGQDAKTVEQEGMFQNKVEEVASHVPDVEVSSVYAELFFRGPMDPTWNPGQVCGSAGDIPVHLAKVRDAEWYAAFMEKYSAYPIEMHLNDERPRFGFHYGFLAMSEDGGHAYTHFHVDTCTGEVIDPASYFLSCYDKGSGYSYDSREYGTTAARLELEDFCVIPVSPWRQSVYDHFKEFRDDLDRYLEAVGRPRSDGPPLVPEEARLDNLESLAYAIYHNYMVDEDIQGNILHYCREYGPLPEDFTTLIESGGADRNLSAC